MTKDQIKLLAKGSYIKDNLDHNKVNKIFKLLNRNDLKLFIKALKNEEKKNTVTIILPDIKLSKRIELEEMFKTKFANKKIIYKTDPSLIVGIKIIDNDTIYEYNLKNTLENLRSYIKN